LNVTGESFMEMHKLFENQYKQLEVSIDEIAERISKLGGTIGTMNLPNDCLQESPDSYRSQRNGCRTIERS
jgi:starvation-inducible DNA-binding protein